jgi:hypothetical protein
MAEWAIIPEARKIAVAAKRFELFFIWIGCGLVEGAELRLGKLFRRNPIGFNRKPVFLGESAGFSVKRDVGSGNEQWRGSAFVSGSAPAPGCCRVRPAPDLSKFSIGLRPHFLSSQPARRVYRVSPPAIAVELDRKLQTLDASTAASVERLVLDALELADQRKSNESTWPVGFWQQIREDLGNEGIERPSQGEFEKRGIW